MPTINQIDYRSGYLNSPLWKAIRRSVLDHYGDVCAVCKAEGGNDVHHVRYAPVLGTEKLEDYQVLCRVCHEAHHKASRSTGKRKKRAVHAKAAYKALTPQMKTLIADKFGIDNDVSLYNQMVSKNIELHKYCAKLLGVPRVIHIPKRKSWGGKQSRSGRSI
jgi:hypothetical protein